MEYFDFVNHVKEAMVNSFGKSAKICINKVVKNNDYELDALSVFTKDENISPTVYLNLYYEQYIKGREFDEILSEIICIFDSHYGDIQFNIDSFTDFNQVKDRIIYKLVNRRLNEKFLKDVPYVPVLDLAIVFMYLLDTGSSGKAVAVIHKNHMDMWKVDKKTLYDVAMENTSRLLPAKHIAMDELIDFLPFEFISEMWILTNEAKFYGAAAMLYENELEKLAEKLNGNLIVLPSSVHEVIVLADNGDVDKEHVAATIQEANENVLDSMDVLSNHAYYYDLKANKLSSW